MPALPAIALGVAAVGTGYSIYNGQKMAGEQQAANQLQRQEADLAAARQQRDAVRQARAAYATTQATAERQGVGLSSSAQGGQGAIVSQIGNTLSFLDRYNTMSDMASQHLGRAIQYEQNEKTGGAIANLGMTTFANAPKINAAFSSIFGSKGP